MQLLDLDLDDYVLTAAVIQRAATLEAELIQQVIEALSAQIGNAVGRVLGG